VLPTNAAFRRSIISIRFITLLFRFICNNGELLRVFLWEFGQNNANSPQLDKLIGLAMLVAASVVFLYYTIWTLLMVIDGLRPMSI
jgi:hypothetical protein